MYLEVIYVLAHTIIIFKVQKNHIFTMFVLKQFLTPLKECMQLSYLVIYFAYLYAGK